MSNQSDTGLEVREVCLLVGNETVPPWFARAVEEMVDRTGVEIGLVVIADSTAPHSSTDRSRISPSRWIRRSVYQNDSWERVTSLPCVSPTRVQRCTVEPADDGGVVLPDGTVDAIADAADVVVHEGVGILKGSVLTATPYGVLSYHHGDLREYRGPGYGFWEYLHGEATSGVTLQRLTEELDAGRVVAFTPVDIHDVYSYNEVRRRLDIASEPLLTEGIRNLNDPSHTSRRVPESELGDLYRQSDVTLAVKTRFLKRELLNWPRKRLSALRSVANAVAG